MYSSLVSFDTICHKTKRQRDKNLKYRENPLCLVEFLISRPLSFGLSKCNLQYQRPPTGSRENLRGQRKLTGSEAAYGVRELTGSEAAYRRLGDAD